MTTQSSLLCLGAAPSSAPSLNLGRTERKDADSQPVLIGGQSLASDLSLNTFTEPKLAIFASAFLIGTGALLLLTNPVILGISALIWGFSIAAVGLVMFRTGIYMELNDGQCNLIDIARLALLTIAGAIAGATLTYLIPIAITAVSFSAIIQVMLTSTAVLVGTGAIVHRFATRKENDSFNDIKKMTLQEEAFIRESKPVPFLENGELSPLRESLEIQLKNRWMLPEGSSWEKVDCGGHEYLSPNEYYPENVAPHLELAKPGIIVTTGTERSFFDLIFSHANCQGMVIIDINPRVKAYNDFNICLLRISDSMEEYAELSNFMQLGDAGRADKLTKIQYKIEQSEMPKENQAYYLRNLTTFLSIYGYFNSFSWSTFEDYFSKVNYKENEKQFLKLQQYARSGNIISVIGSIDELQFLDGNVISVVDTSNITDYTRLNFTGNSFSPRTIPPIPTIIYTNGTCLDGTFYYSYARRPIPRITIQMPMIIGGA